MEIPLGRFQLAKDKVFIDVSESEIDPFVKLKLAESALKKSYTILPGTDFENNLLFDLFGMSRRRLIDHYIETKLGQQKKNSMMEEYNEEVKNHLSRDDILKLLYVCRICTYFGGPGFPDFIVIRPEGKVAFMYVGSEADLQASQVVFAFILKDLLGKSVQLIDVVSMDYPIKEQESVELDAKRVLQSFIDSRVVESAAKMEERIREASQKIQAAPDGRERQMLENQLKFLRDERDRTLFIMFKGWLERGSVGRDSILSGMRALDGGFERQEMEFEQQAHELAQDSTYQSFGKIKTEEIVNKKARHVAEKFLLPEKRSRELVEFADGAPT